ncbi:MAG: Fe-S protein assembly co-chaperone HscB [Bacteroidota bacterium]|jgi:molecular chaperone HscB
MNYFELFGIPEKILFDRSVLNKIYVQLQKQFHPDFYTQADEEAQMEAMEKSSLLNKALKVLQNEDLTIQYILQTHGMLTDDEKYQLPADFLMEMMDLNEDFSEETPQIIHGLERSLRNDALPYLQAFDATNGSADELEKIKEFYFKKKYLQRILDRING